MLGKFLIFEVLHIAMNPAAPGNTAAQGHCVPHFLPPVELCGGQSRGQPLPLLRGLSHHTCHADSVPEIFDNIAGIYINRICKIRLLRLCLHLTLPVAPC